MPPFPFRSPRRPIGPERSRLLDRISRPSWPVRRDNLPDFFLNNRSKTAVKEHPPDVVLRWQLRVDQSLQSGEEVAIRKIVLPRAIANADMTARPQHTMTLCGGRSRVALMMIYVGHEDQIGAAVSQRQRLGRRVSVAYLSLGILAARLLDHF